MGVVAYMQGAEEEEEIEVKMEELSVPSMALIVRCGPEKEESEATTCRRRGFVGKRA